MTMNHTLEVLEMTGSADQALEFHLSSRFYPPLREGHKDAIREAIRAFNAYEIDFEEFVKGTYARDQYTALKHFSPFIQERLEADGHFDYINHV